MSASRELTCTGRSVVPVLAALFFASCAPKTSQVDLDAVLSRPQLYNGKVIRVTGCIKQFHHGVLLGQCKSDNYETAVFSEDLRADQLQAYRNAAAQAYQGQGAPHCLTGHFRFVAGKVSSQWLELRDFSIGSCNASKLAK